MDLVKEFKQQYLITKKAREDDLYSKDHMNAMAKLEKLFYKIPENQKMGTCDADCKQEMFFKKVKGGWAAVCECNQSFFMKTFEMPR
jgi:hypothetical protein